MQLNLFGRDKEFRKKPLKLVFLLRDYDAQTPTQKIEEQIRRQIHEVYEELNPEEDCSGNSMVLADVVQQEYVFLPHRTFCPAEFTVISRGLRRWLVLPDAYSREVEAQDLTMFAKAIWTTIWSDKEVNLLSQKELLSLYRCGRTVDRVRQSCTEVLRTLSAEFVLGAFNGAPVFQAVSSAVEDATLEFNVDVFGYADEVVQQKLEQLIGEILPLARETFAFGVQEARKKSTCKLKIDLEALVNASTCWQNCGTEFSTLREYCVANFQDLTQFDYSSQMYESWRPVIISESDRVQDDIDVCLTVARERVLRIVQGKFEKEMVEAVAPPIESLISLGNLDLWECATAICREKWKDIKLRLRDALVQVGVDEVDQQVERIREKLRFTVVEHTRTVIGSSSNFYNRLALTVRQFLPENWASQPDSTSLIAEARSRAFETLILFSVIRIGGLDGSVEPAVQHFSYLEHEDLVQELNRLEASIIQTARANQFQRNVRIAEVVLSTATVIGMAAATAALGTFRRA
eukprot:Plantae.Rhodophyta-Purpureofilum_apyrenoidigerum.ctg26823.p1 GENE.Plantae.Rhodophyta-Purpureofilum_apyrenoidigerum.ctg26823~~Plantae.Rhodophyta-Purpureofilum_apyrenoidigerum.ctg26823.p1  ORF type:complete len:519 (-),score=77.04 Plantae.Rhodophyta-Purpureofilum_apyrenoidigerum.ctg26823:97-1653(-)